MNWIPSPVVDCVWAEWSEWTVCPHTCPVETQVKTRTRDKKVEEECNGYCDPNGHFEKERCDRVADLLNVASDLREKLDEAAKCKCHL